MKEETRKKLVRLFWILFLVPIGLFFLLLLAVWLFADIPSFRELESPDSKLATLVLAEDGRVLTTFHIENRTYVMYDELSPYLEQAAVATEDKRFYSHSGIDIPSLGRVMLKTMLGHDSSQGGGSTITQQLAKTLYPREQITSRFPGARMAGMVWIKMKEWVTAIKLERSYTKPEILNMYMNAIFFGSNSYGIKAASETFFSKNPIDLNIQEAATLVGMVNKPTRYNPHLNYDNSLKRRNLVLSRMCEQGCITREQCDSISALPIELRYNAQDNNTGRAPYFRDMLRRTMNAQRPERSSYRIVEDYLADSLAWADDPLYGWLNKNFKADGSKYNLDKDGLRIHTTINYDMQRYAEEAVEEHMGLVVQRDFDREQKYNSKRPFSAETSQETINSIMKQARRWSDRYRTMKKEGFSESQINAAFDKKTRMTVFAWKKSTNSQGKVIAVPSSVDTVMTPNDSIRYYKGIMRCAFMAMEPFTGWVKAYVGGPNYRYFKYDNIGQGKRQVGSTIKPFLYTLAMQEGMTPCTRVVNVPQTFDIGEDQTWTPRTTDKAEWIGQSVTLKWGIMKSSNNISAYLMKQFGPAAMIDMMRRMGITSYLDEVYSLCVGSCDLSVKEMVAAYNTYPSNGVYVRPQMVTSIEDNLGNVITTFTTKKHEAISESSAYLMRNLMAGVVNNGTAYRLRGTYALQGEMCGKTGTNNDQADAWFIGYTPKITAGVWTGAEDRQVHFRSSANGSGSAMALPIWGLFLSKCIKGGNVGLSSSDTFSVPQDCNVSMDCGGDILESSPTESCADEEETEYFD